MDSREKIEALLAKAEPIFRRRFLESISSIKDALVLDELSRLLEAGRIDEALSSVEQAARNFASAAAAVYVVAGDEAAKFVADQLQVLVRFDQTNTRAVLQMQRNQLRLISEFTEAQRISTRAILTEGIQAGLNPRETARILRDSIGLTEYQLESIRNYRRLLESNSAQALHRELRDARSDRSVTRALARGEPLGATQIDSMVDRYRENWLSFRAENIARTESLSAVHEGADEMYRQAFDTGLLAPDELTQTWKTIRDARRRDSHVSMEGQQRSIGEPFLSGDGNLLMYPGDPSAPVEDRAQCRCVKTTRFAVDAQA